MPRVADLPSGWRHFSTAEKIEHLIGLDRCYEILSWPRAGLDPLPAPGSSSGQAFRGVARVPLVRRVLLGSAPPFSQRLRLPLSGTRHVSSWRTAAGAHGQLVAHREDMLVVSKVRYEANLSAASHLDERPESALVTRSGPDRRRSGFHPLKPFVVRRDHRPPAILSGPGPPMTRHAERRLIVWCRSCAYQVEPDPARRYGADTPVLNWRSRAYWGSPPRTFG
jgi:hypothetical protein